MNYYKVIYNGDRFLGKNSIKEMSFTVCFYFI